MTAIDIGYDPDAGGNTSFGSWNDNGYVTFLSIYNPVAADGGITDAEIQYANTCTSQVTGTLTIYSCADLGGGSYQLNARSSATGITFPASSSGKKTLSELDLETHEGDVVGLRVYCPGNDPAFLFSVGCGADVGSNVRDYKLSDFTTGQVIPGDTTPLKIYATGTAYPVGGGVGGTPPQSCHSVSETVEEDEASSGLWGVVEPRSFGLSGGNDAAYVDLTFPWDTEGTYQEDEIFVDGVKKSFENPDNSLEHYTLQMDVTRFTGDDATIVNPSFEPSPSVLYGWSANQWWSGDYFVSQTEGGGATDGVKAAWLSNGCVTVGDYAEIYQNITAKKSFTLTFDTYMTKDVGGDTVFQVLYDDSVVYSKTPPTDAHTLYEDESVNITSTSGTHKLAFRFKCLTASSLSHMATVDNLRVTSTYATGACSAFQECWWIEDANGDVYVNKTSGDDDDLGISWDTAFETYDKGYSEVETGGTIHIKAESYTTTHTAVFPAKNCMIKPYVNASATPTNQVKITKV